MRLSLSIMLLLVALSVLLLGCAREQAEPDVPGPDADQNATAGDDIPLSVDEVDEGLVEDDLEQSMDSIDLEDW